MRNVTGIVWFQNGMKPHVGFVVWDDMFERTVRVGGFCCFCARKELCEFVFVKRKQRWMLWVSFIGSPFCRGTTDDIDNIVCSVVCDVIVSCG